MNKKKIIKPQKVNSVNIKVHNDSNKSRGIYLSKEETEELLEYDISIHIFTASIAMIGVCFTVIGLVRVSNNIQKLNSLADDLIFFNVFLYLTACFSSYISIRSKKKNQKRNFEKAADLFFMISLIITFIICGFMVFENMPNV